MRFLAFPIAVVLLFAGPAMAQSQSASVVSAESVHYGWADVLRVDPVYDHDSNATRGASATPSDCYEELVPTGTPQSNVTTQGNGKRTVASVFGAIIGGLLGNRFGKGNGRTAATAAGTVAGGVIGNRLAADSDRPDQPEYTTQRHCPPTAAPTPRPIVGYDVEYRYRGDIYSSRLSYDPGDRLRVRVMVEPAER